MPKFQHVLRTELDPTQPVKEICDVIQAITPPQREAEVLTKVREAIDARLNEIENGADRSGKSVANAPRN